MTDTARSPGPLLLSVRETADALSICEKSLYTLTRTGRLRAVRIGRRVLYDRTDLLAFIESAKEQHR